MNAEKKLEVKRQLFHLTLGTTIALVVWILKPKYGNFILIPLLMAIFLLLALPKVAPDSKVSKHLLTHFEREKMIKKFPYKGAILYGVGIIFPILLLPVELACVVILILSIGDAASTLIGKFHGKLRIGDKSLEGTIAFIIFGFTGVILFLEIIGSMELAKKVFLLTVVGALVELQGVVDDNLTVPIALTILARLI